MTQERPAPIRARAFTLIEVLLAVSVFAIVLGAINSVFFGALRLRNKTTEAFETALPLQHTLNIIQRDFDGIMIPGGRFGGSFTTTLEGISNNAAFIGERITPDIYTSSGAVGESAQWSDVQKVAYFLAIPTNSAGLVGEGKELVRQVTGNLLAANVEESEVQFLMGGVQAMSLQYYDGLNWADSWAYTNLPSAIKVQIALAKHFTNSSRTPMPIELIVPIMVQGTTNSTEEAGGDQ
jgi:general secretion pathway protein J